MMCCMLILSITNTNCFRKICQDNIKAIVVVPTLQVKEQPSGVIDAVPVQSIVHTAASVNDPEPPLSVRDQRWTERKRMHLESLPKPSIAPILPSNVKSATDPAAPRRPNIITYAWQ